MFEQAFKNIDDILRIGTFEYQRFPFPPLEQQHYIVQIANALIEETERLEALYQQKLTALEELKQALLHQAFTGQL